MSKISNQKGKHERRCEEQICGPIKPFGAKVEYHTISAEDQARLHQFGKNDTLGHLDGLRSTCGEKLERGGLLVADVEELQENDASEVYLRRKKTKEGMRRPQLTKNGIS